MIVLSVLGVGTFSIIFILFDCLFIVPITEENDVYVGIFKGVSLGNGLFCCIFSKVLQLLLVY